MGGLVRFLLLEVEKSAQRKKRIEKEMEDTLPLASVGGAVASWLVRSSLDRAVRAPGLAGDIELCSWENT